MDDTPDDDFALDLSEKEAAALARRVIARHLDGDRDWLDWGDLPYLSESAFLRMDQAVDRHVRDLMATFRFEGIDSAYLMEVAQSGRPAVDSDSGRPTEEASDASR